MVERTTFRFPVLVNSKFHDSIQSFPFQANNVSDTRPYPVATYKFTDTIDIAIATDYCSAKRQERIGYPAVFQLYDSLDVNGFEIYVNYDQTVRLNPSYFRDSIVREYFPVYLVNSTQSVKTYLAKENSGFGIQEAYSNESPRRWRPIEFNDLFMCGMGTWHIPVYQNEFVLLLFRKYDGDFTTKHRVRVQIGETVYVSKTFDAKINSDQFSIPDSSILWNSIMIHVGRASKVHFCGAIPRQLEYNYDR